MAYMYLPATASDKPVDYQYSFSALALNTHKLIFGTRDGTGPDRNWKNPGVDHELGRYDQLGDKIRKLNPDIKVDELEGLGLAPQTEAFDRFIPKFDKAISM